MTNHEAVQHALALKLDSMFGPIMQCNCGDTLDWADVARAIGGDAMHITDAMIEAGAQAVADELARQDYGVPFPLPSNLVVEYLDQGETDLGEVARRCIEAALAVTVAQEKLK
jgi:hypothetical protein